MSNQNPNQYIGDILELMSRLRDKRDGCPWDIEQDFSSITPFTIEEVYEVVDAIDRGDYGHLQEELGDLFFQIIFYCQLAQELTLFSFADVVEGLTRKLISRHPHVFPEGSLASRRQSSVPIDQARVKQQWEAQKKAEREKKGERNVLADIPKSLPAIQRAEKLQSRAAKVNFDWPHWQGAAQKIEEELNELKAVASASSRDQEALEDELGDLMFSCINVARHLKVSPERALRRANLKFETRFEKMEARANQQDQRLEELSEDDWNTLWESAKADTEDDTTGIQ